jgi:hypothetical protein
LIAIYLKAYHAASVSMMALSSSLDLYWSYLVSALTTHISTFSVEIFSSITCFKVYITSFSASGIVIFRW